MIIFMSPLFALAAQQVIALVAATFDYLAPLIYMLPISGTISAAASRSQHYACRIDFYYCTCA